MDGLNLTPRPPLLFYGEGETPTRQAFFCSLPLPFHGEGGQGRVRFFLP